MSVLFRKNNIICRYVSVYIQSRVVPSNRTLALRSVKVVALILEQGGLAQYAEAVRKSPRDEELAVLLARELYSYVPDVCRRSLSDINRHVKDSTLITSLFLAKGSFWKCSPRRSMIHYLAQNAQGLFSHRILSDCMTQISILSGL